MIAHAMQYQTTHLFHSFLDLIPGPSVFLKSSSVSKVNNLFRTKLWQTWTTTAAHEPQASNLQNTQSSRQSKEEQLQSSFPCGVLLSTSPAFDASKQLLRCIRNVFDGAEDVLQIRVWTDHLASFCWDAPDWCQPPKTACVPVNHCWLQKCDTHV